MYFVIGSFDEYDDKGNSFKVYETRSFNTESQALDALRQMLSKTTECYIAKSLPYDVKSNYDVELNKGYPIFNIIF